MPEALFLVVYVSPPKQVINLARLPNGIKKSVVAEALVEQVHDVLDEVKQRLEQTNAKYKVAVD